MRLVRLSILCFACAALQVPMAWCDDLGLHPEIAVDAHKHDCCGVSLPASDDGFAATTDGGLPHAHHVTAEFPFLQPPAKIAQASVHVTFALDLANAHLMFARAITASATTVERSSARARTTVQLL